MSDITVVITCFNYGRYLQEAVDSAIERRSESRRRRRRLDGTAARVAVGGRSDSPGEPGRGAGAKRRSLRERRRRSSSSSTRTTASRRGADGCSAIRSPPIPTLGFAYGRMRFFGDWEGELRFPPYDPYALLYRHTIGLSALARREVFDDTGGFDPAFGQFEDWELWVNALAHGWRGLQVDAVTVEYRRHEGSKHARDRPAYRKAFRQLREKHADLYRRPPTGLGPLSRPWYRFFWGTDRCRRR